MQLLHKQNNVETNMQLCGPPGGGEAQINTNPCEAESTIWCMAKAKPSAAALCQAGPKRNGLYNV